MNSKIKLKISETLLCFFALLLFTAPSVSCAVFEPVCNVETVDENNRSEPVIIGMFHNGQNPLPEEFSFKIIFDGDIFKKNAKIDYSPEIWANYRHNKSVCGNEIDVYCSLKNNGITPIIPEDEEILCLVMECKKSVTKPETNLTVVSECAYEKATADIPIKIRTACSNPEPMRLSKLIPNTGELEPSFNPDVTEYSLCVPYSTKTIAFDYNCESGCSAQINRHNLNPPGSTTDVYITLKRNQRGAKNTYHISVKREALPLKSPREQLIKEKSSKNKTRSSKSKSHSQRSKSMSAPTNIYSRTTKMQNLPKSKTLKLKNPKNPLKTIKNYI